MNFTELYKKIRTLDETDPGQAAQPVSPAMARLAAAKAAGTLPAAPVGLSTTNTGNVPGAQPVGGSSAAMSNPVATKTNIAPGQPLPANAGAVKGESMGDKEVEECGPMGPSGMMGMRDQQPDNVSMNLSMNGQGPGGIRDLLDILKDIGNTSSESDAGPDSSGDLELAIGSMSHPHDEPEHEEEDGLVFGNDMEEEYGNEPNEMYSTVDDVTNMGSNDGRGANERPKVNGGGNPYAVTSEGIKRQLQNLYYEVKSR
jgi:hypothetical protein